MFERFTTDARQVVTDAQREARGLGHTWIGTEHLLLAVLAGPGSPVRDTLAELGVTYADVRAEVVDELSGPSGDEEALRDLGIDLDDVRRRVEASFGPGALDDQGRHHGRRRFGRRRRSAADRQAQVSGQSGSSRERAQLGHIPFTRRAKMSLELALREALRLHCKEISSAHLVLGIMRADGLAARAVAARGVTPDEVRRAVLDRLSRAA